MVLEPDAKATACPDPRDAKGNFWLIKISKGLLSMDSLVPEILSKAEVSSGGLIRLFFLLRRTREGRRITIQGQEHQAEYLFCTRGSGNSKMVCVSPGKEAWAISRDKG